MFVSREPARQRVSRHSLGLFRLSWCTAVLGLFLADAACDHALPHSAKGAPGKSSLATIARRAPTIAAAIERDDGLEAILGPEKYAQALARVARFVETSDPECRLALDIIGDTIPRTKARVDEIQLDGDDLEWRRIIPPPDAAKPPEPKRGRSRDDWPHGAAAVVREGRLYVTVGVDARGVGLNAPAYVTDPGNRLEIRIDCTGDRAWDVVLTIRRRDGVWRGEWRPVAGGKQPPTAVKDLEVGVGRVVELGVDIEDFAPQDAAKPIWTIALTAYVHGDGVTRRAETAPFAVFDECAAPGVTAGPYVRSLLFLAADTALGRYECIAAAVAVSGAVALDMTSPDVHDQVRRDNAALLRFAWDTVAWQNEHDTEYRLNEYPLEALLAWADRVKLSQNRKYFNLARDPGKALNDAEHYGWFALRAETLRAMRATAEREGLVTASLGETARNIDRWIGHVGIRGGALARLRRAIEQNRDHPAELAKLNKQYARKRHISDSKPKVISQFLGRDVSELHVHNSAVSFEQIQKQGRWLGGCIGHTFVCQDFLRAVGIAPLHFRVCWSREEKKGHNWVAHYDPRRRVWCSNEPGRSRGHWWYFDIVRVPVFTYALQAQPLDPPRRHDPLPWPLFYERELQGREVRKLAQTEGISTTAIRMWLLAPCFHRASGRVEAGG